MASQRHHARATRLVAGAVLLAGLAACGGTAAPLPRGAWRANATQLLFQIRDDVADVEAVGPTRAAAAEQLPSTSDLFRLLLAYTDLSGCSGMVSATGAPPGIERRLALPCVDLQRAATLFTEATANHDPQALVAATREAGRAEPALVRAALALPHAQ